MFVTRGFGKNGTVEMLQAWARHLDARGAACTSSAAQRPVAALPLCSHSLRPGARYSGQDPLPYQCLPPCMQERAERLGRGALAWQNLNPKKSSAEGGTLGFAAGSPHHRAHPGDPWGHARGRTRRHTHSKEPSSYSLRITAPGDRLPLPLERQLWTVGQSQRSETLLEPL